jgi:lysozyme
MAQVSQRLTDFVAAEEGLVTRAYRCPAGVLTIGYGHTSAAGAPKVEPGMTITAAEAKAILARDLETFARRAAAALPVAREHEVEGATSFDFNTGRIHNASWPKLLRQGRRQEAAASLMQWTKAGGRELAGLRRRREHERDIVFHDKWPGKDALPAPASWPEDLGALGHSADAAGVREFQAKHGLVVDGIVGPATRAAIRRALEARTTNRAAAVGAAPGGAVAANEAAAPAPDPELASVAADGSDAMVLALILLVGLPLLIWGCGWLWRNRGRITGRRVWA